MRVICIDNKTNMDKGPFATIYTEGKIYDAVPDGEWTFNKQRFNAYKITDDTGYTSSYNFNPESGVWINFRKLHEHRQKKLSEIGL